MSIKLFNNSISRLKLGSSNVSKIYLGSNQIWPSVPVNNYCTIESSLLLNFDPIYYPVDNSSNHFTITSYNNPIITDSQSKWNDRSIYFDNHNAYIEITGGTVLPTATEDFTVETWIRFKSDQSLVDIGTLLLGPTTRYGGAFQICFFGARVLIGALDVFLGNGTPWQLECQHSMTTNIWYHLAITKQNNTIRVFQDGIKIGEAYADYSYANINGAAIGNNAWNLSDHGIDAYIEDFRIIKGDALYTSDFTPPTNPLTADSNTSLLLNFVDYNDRFKDSSINNLNIIKNGNPIITDQESKYGNFSGYFSHSGDILTIQNNSAFTFGSDPFTVEFWFRSENWGSGEDIQSRPVSCYTNPEDENAWLFEIG